MPFVNVMTPAKSWQTATVGIGPLHFGVGHFLSLLLNFLIVGFVAWQITKQFIMPKPDEKAATKDCPYCYQSIDTRATRCAYCTTEVRAA